ncbi:MAG: DNA mismatch repair protein MutS [Flavobacteriaceae bacterium]|nr:DNA mismatch repair protein MutS [Flavobacteriaceae bacterium]
MKEAKKTRKVTPLMQQYNSIKSKHPDALLLFRVGDFYETFGEDAKKAAEALGIVLTQRNNGGDKTALAGFPHHALHTYLPKLVKAGYRVAICDQLEDPKQTKTIVKRGVTELVTPGVALSDDLLQAKENNFLAAVYPGRNGFGVSFLDISTGEFLVSEGTMAQVERLLENFQPSEILLPKSQKQELEAWINNGHLFVLDEWIFQEDYTQELLSRHFGTASLKGFGIEHLPMGIIAAGAVMHYISETQHTQIKHISRIQRISSSESVWLDHFTVRNLELFRPTHPQGVSLYEIIDRTVTPMGGRLLRRWLALPLLDLSTLANRHEIVGYWLDEQESRQSLRSSLKKIGDLERILSKIATGKVTPREAVHFGVALAHIAPIQELCKQKKSKALNFLAGNLNSCEKLIERIQTVLDDNAAAQVGKGAVIAEGYSEELDDLRKLAYSGKEYLDAMVQREIENTGISTLKIASNNVFGYYLEVRNAHKDKVPESWIRKQTLVNAERYITEELKEYEAKILGAEERILELERHLFEQLILWMRDFIQPVQENARLLAELDCLSAFGQLAEENAYVAPEMHTGLEIEIRDGRHPVIEKQLPPGEPFIPNDVVLNTEEQQILMITGPNMSGKSAILRQTALIVLLAQIGSYVPAASARIGYVDKIFTRVGASDNISVGESTFMVEMNETASILNNLSDRSLILLDEIGRGTSTYDGISIAWAISEFLHEHPARAKTLFATHYHELNEMSSLFERIKNFNVAIKEVRNKILFLRKLEPGGSEHSFGIHVARMAGMPQQVLRKANKLLVKLEKSHSSEELGDDLKEAHSDSQLSFFKLDDPLLEEIRDEILHLDINTLTPVEALMKLNEIKRMLTKRNKATS